MRCKADENVYRTAGVCWRIYIGLGFTPYHLLGSATLLADNKQQELTSLILETPLPTRIALIGYTGQYDTIGKLIVQHNIKEVTKEEAD